MPKSIYALLILLVLLHQTNTQTFCSATCMYSYAASSYTPLCSGPLSTDCTGCDSTFFSHNGTACDTPNTTYTFQEKDFYPNGVIDGTWSTTNAAGYSINTFNTSYTIVNFIGNTSISKSFVLPIAHSSLRIRMFILIVGNPTYDFKIVLDGNTSNPIAVDNSSRLYLSNTSSASYIYTSADIPHSSSGVEITLLVGNLSGTASSFGIKQLMLFTKNCPKECTSCDSSAVCYGCALIGTTQYMLAGGKCMFYCPMGYYVSAAVTGVCGSCDQSCVTCSMEASNCTSCGSSSNPAWSYLYMNTCVEVCPTGYYPENKICMACFQGCLMCNGTGKDNCQSCTLYNGNNYYLVSGTTSCALSCPPGQYYDMFFPNQCLICDPLCLTCQSSSVTCKSCTTNGTYQSFLYTTNNTCMATCPNGFQADSSTHTCICNSSNYISYLGVCSPCSSACKTCYGGSTADYCLTCANMYYMLVNTTQCKTTCPSGQYPEPSALQCASCDNACFTCSGSSSYCTGCKAGTYLFGSVCLSDCPVGYMKGTSPNKCIQCEVSMVSYNGSCLSVCPPGYTAYNLACYSLDIINKKQANFTTSLSVVNSGTRLQIDIKFSVPMSKNTTITHNSINVSVKSFVSRRLLETTQHLLIKNILVDSSYSSIKILTAIPNNIDNYKSLILSVDFDQNKLFSSDGLVYTTYSGSFLMSTPSFVSELYNNYYRSSLSGVGIFFTVVGALLLVLSFWNKYSMYSCVEFFMMLQAMHIFAFAHYPQEFSLSSYLTGFSSSQFQFMPNIFNIAAGTYLENAFPAYQFKTIDMNFLRLSSPVLLTFIIISFIMGYMHMYDKKSLKNVLKKIGRMLMYIVSMNLVFSGISSLVGLFINYSNTQAVFVLSQMLGLSVLGLLIGYYWRRSGLFKNKMFIVGNLIHCIIIPLFSISTSIFLILDTLIQAVLLIYFWKKVMNRKDRRDNFAFIERVISIIILNVIVMVSWPVVVITIISTLLFICLLMTIFLYYKGIRKHQHVKRTHQKSSSNRPMVIAPLGTTNISSANFVLPSNNTLITELDEKIPHYLAGAQSPTIIYEHDMEQSPAKHRSQASVVLEKPLTREMNKREKRSDQPIVLDYKQDEHDSDKKAATSRYVDDLEDQNYREAGSVFEPTPKRKVRFEMFRKRQDESHQESSEF